MARNISDVLNFRNDFSPFLTHMTRDRGGSTAHDILENIIADGFLKCSNEMISAAQYGTTSYQMSVADRKRFFAAISFTETPLNELHTLLEIANRQVNLEPYGLVFLKENLKKKDVSPVIYVNNEQATKDQLFQSLCTLINRAATQAEKILPLFSVFGKEILAPWARNPNRRDIDFLWEREWRFPSAYGNFDLDNDDIFVGLCPHDEIAHFEALLPDIGFVDPRRNMKWYAKKLIDARQRLNLTSSVV